MLGEYDQVSELECGVRRFECQRKWGLLDEKGTVILQPKYNYIFEFEDGVAQVKKYSLYGVIDNKGCEIIEPIYYSIFDFDGELAIVYNGTFWGAVNKKGCKIIPTIYDKEFHFWGGEYAIVKTDKGYNIIRRNGSYVLDEMCDWIQYQDRKYYIIKNGRCVTLEL